MSKHKTAAIAPSFHNGIVFKRKGKRVRYIDPATAKVGPWTRVHSAFGIAAESPVIEAVETAARNYSRMTVAELFPLARSRFGMLVTTKTRKAELVRMLTESDTKGF